VSNTPADFAQVANVISTLAEAGQRPRRGKEAIPAAKSAGSPIGEKVGEGRAGENPSSSGAGSIASPLTERDASVRTYHPAQDVFSEDGTLVKVYPVKSIRMTDANGEAVDFNYAIPDYASITP
jgi:hypothetical protein